MFDCHWNVAIRGLAAALALVGIADTLSRAAETERKGAAGYRAQDLDDPLEKHVPLKGRTVSDQARLDAATWFMTGQLREKRNDFTGALEAFKKGIELDPTAVPIYRALVPLAFSLSQTKEAVQHAEKAIELDPDDVFIRRRLGVHYVKSGKIPEAVQLFEKAIVSPRVNKASAMFVALHRDLALTYAATGQMEKSSDSFEVVIDAVLNPEKYELDDRTRKALQDDPATTFESIGQVFLEAKRTERAIDLFEKALKSGRRRPGALNFHLARAYQQTMQHEKALAELQKYLDAPLPSKTRGAYELLAIVLKDLGKEDDLIPQLEALAGKDARNATLQYFLAEQYAAAGKTAAAEDLFKKTIESTKDPEGYIGLARLYRRANKPEDLVHALGKGFSGRSEAELARNLGLLEIELKAISEDAKLVDALVAAGRKLAEGDSPKLDFNSSYLLAKLAVTAKKTDAVIEFYRFALKARRDNAEMVYKELGAYLMQEDEYAEAAKVFREAAGIPALAGERAEFLYRLSYAEAFANNTQGALDAVVEAKKLLPDNPGLFYQEAWVHYHAKQYDEAIRLFEATVAKFPENREIVRRCQFSLSNIYVQQGDQRKGEEVLEKVLEQDPDDPSVNNDLGYLYADQGKHLEKAEKMIRKAIAAEPENAAYLDSMGWVLFKLGRFEEALPYLEKAVKLPSGSDSTLYDHLGDCYDRLKQTEKAIEAWKTALDHAKKEAQPDKKLIERIEEKLKNRQ